MPLKVEPIKPAIGAVVHADRSAFREPGFAEQVLELLEQHTALVFPRAGLSDEEQLAFTDNLGARVNFTSRVPGGDESAQDVYTITLDKDINSEPEYVLGSMFWHMDGITSDIPPPKATILSCHRAAPRGGETDFASTYAAYEALSDEEKSELESLRVVHSVVAAVREVASAEEIDPVRRGYAHEHPLVWTHESGRKSLLVGYTADYVVGMPKAQGRALLARLLEWTAQPDFTCRHRWREGDLAIWDNCGALHRALPYDENSGRSMHRTSVAGHEAVA